jgi:hypothetical protein
MMWFGLWGNEEGIIYIKKKHGVLRFSMLDFGVSEKF